jgi:hypothetical protein
MSITRNLLKHWNRASRSQRVEGRGWYTGVRRVIRGLARKYGRSKATVAGVLAATSPRLTWATNLAVTEALLAGRAVRGVFRASLDKARAILDGAKPLVVLGGDKVRAFYRALTGDRSAVVIDVWMLRAAGLDPEARLDRGGLYAKVSAALAGLARRLNVAVAELQATIWVAARGRAG